MKPSYCFRATKTALVLGLAAALIGHVARGEDEKLVTIAAPKARSFCSRVVGRLALFAGIALAPTIFYEARRLPQGQRHCGHGIRSRVPSTP